MTRLGQIQREAQRPTGILVSPKNSINIGCWNVRTMAEASRAAQVAKEMKEYNLEVLGISESRWTGVGSLILQSGATVVYVGDDEAHVGGVAIMMSPRAKRALLQWTPVSQRIITARFYSRHKKLTIVQVYAPTNDAAEDDKEEFYHALQDTLEKCNKHDMIIVMGDLNAKVGADNESREEIMGKQGVGDMNENGERLCDLCAFNGLVITGTLFHHKTIHKTTWKSPDGRTTNQIDHVMVNKTMRSSVLNTRVMRGADVYSDHYLVRTTIRMKLAKNNEQQKGRERFDIAKLKDEDTRQRYNIEVRNRFQALGDIEDPEAKHSEAIEIYRDVAKNVLGRTKKKSKPWIREGTWKRVAERKILKQKLEDAKSDRLKERWKEKYKAKDKEVKSSAREDKRTWMEEQSKDAEQAAVSGRTQELYKTIKTIAGVKPKPVSAVKDKEGVLRTEQSEKMARWAEHFRELLNRDDPVDPVTLEEVDEGEEIEDIGTGDWTVDEVKSALKSVKSGKAAGIDEISPELLKADLDGTAGRLCAVYNSLWNEERWPQVWKKGLIHKIFKKGDARDCNNWRGITLLPIDSKIFCRMIINRMKKGVDKKLRKEQAGFRPGRGTTEQIFILRNILEQANEWQAGIYIHFIDFEKAFDSVHREGLWTILRSYGIPEKIVRAIRGIYDGFECAIIDENKTSEWFEVKTGVKQGCVMSGFLFLIVIDWVMRRTTADKRRGIRWDFTTVLEDLDFADDIVLLSSKFSDMKEKTEKLIDEAERVGLKLNSRKCKTLRSKGTKSRENIRVNGQEVEEVDEFVYLGAIVDKEGGGSKDIKNRIQKARGAYRGLWRIWSARGIGQKTKLRLYNTLVRPVLLYGCETWKLTKAEERKLDTFQFQCLRKILGIRWQQHVTNDRVNQLSGVTKISSEVRRRRWNWLGHIFRREGENDSRVALGWTPEGRRARGRPKMTWRRTVEKERKKAGWSTWGEAKAAAQNRPSWSGSVAALCAFWHGED